MSDNPASSARTGVDGKVVVEGSKLARITKWAISPKAGVNEWGDSDGEGFTLALPGRRGCTGSIEGKFDEDDEVYEILREGDDVTLVLWQSEVAGDYWAFPAVIIADFSLEYDVDGQTVVGWSASWNSSGRFYHPGESGAPAHTLPS